MDTNEQAPGGTPAPEALPPTAALPVAALNEDIAKAMSKVTTRGVARPRHPDLPKPGTEWAPGTPTVRLGHDDWPVPEFVWGQNKKLLPLMRRLAEMEATKPTEADLDTLGKIMYLGISGGTPTLKPDHMDLIPMALRQQLMALDVFLAQSDVEVQKVGEPEAQPQMEAPPKAGNT